MQGTVLNEDVRKFLTWGYLLKDFLSWEYYARNAWNYYGNKKNLGNESTNWGRSYKYPGKSIGWRGYSLLRIYLNN